jgi:hypothetical protein
MTAGISPMRTGELSRTFFADVREVLLGERTNRNKRQLDLAKTARPGGASGAAAFVRCVEADDAIVRMTLIRACAIGLAVIPVDPTSIKKTKASRAARITRESLRAALGLATSKPDI